MTPESILAKSSKGLEEIETRVHRLGSRLRQVLVRVNGEKTVNEMVEEAGDLGEGLYGQLEELVRQGFLEDRNPGAEAVPAEPTATQPITQPPRPTPPVNEPQPVAGVAPEAAAPVTFDSPVKFKLQDLLVDAVGIETGRMGKALEQCRSREELARWVDTALPFILQMAGKSKANAFAKSARKLVGN